MTAINQGFSLLVKTAAYHHIVPREDKTISFIWLHSIAYALKKTILQFIIQIVLFSIRIISILQSQITVQQH